MAPWYVEKAMNHEVSHMFCITGITRLKIAIILFLLILLQPFSPVIAQELEKRFELDTSGVNGLIVARWLVFDEDATYFLYRGESNIGAFRLGLEGTVSEPILVSTAPKGKKFSAVLDYAVIEQGDRAVIYMLVAVDERILQIYSLRVDRNLKHIGKRKLLFQTKMRARFGQIFATVRDDATGIAFTSINNPLITDRDIAPSRTFFFEVDNDGQKKKTVHDLTPGRDEFIGSNMRIAPPLWTGEFWLLPILHDVQFFFPDPLSRKGFAFFSFMREFELVTISDADLNKPVIERKLLTEYEGFSSVDSLSFSFLNPSRNAPDGLTENQKRSLQFRLLLQEKIRKPFLAFSYVSLESSFNIFTFQFDGREVGDGQALSLPRFASALEVEEGAFTSLINESFSVSHLPDGSVLFGLNQGLNVTDNETDEVSMSENTLHLLRYSEGRNRFRKVSSENIETQRGVFLAPQFRLIEDTLYSLATKVFVEKRGDIVSVLSSIYLSRYSR